MSAPEAVWSPRKDMTLPLPVPEDVERLPSLPWRLILLGVVLPPLVAFCLSRAGGSSEERAPEGPPRPAEAAGHSEGDGLEVSGLFRQTGDFFYDLCEAFEKGGASEVVRLETQWEHDLFDRIRKARASKGIFTNLTFSLMDRGTDGVEIYQVEDYTGPLGMIFVQWIDDRWTVVGAWPPIKGTGSRSPGDKPSRDEALSALNSLINARDPAVRKAAAEALKAMEQQKVQRAGDR